MPSNGQTNQPGAGQKVIGQPGPGHRPDEPAGRGPEGHRDSRCRAPASRTPASRAWARRSSGSRGRAPARRTPASRTGGGPEGHRRAAGRAPASRTPASRAGPEGHRRAAGAEHRPAEHRPAGRGPEGHRRAAGAEHRPADTGAPSRVGQKVIGGQPVPGTGQQTPASLSRPSSASPRWASNPDRPQAGPPSATCRICAPSGMSVPKPAAGSSSRSPITG